MAPTFVQILPSDPLYLLEASFPSQMAGYTIAFWPGSATPDQSLTLLQTWQIGGTYLFLGAVPTDQVLLTEALTRYLSDPAYPDATFLWIANPNDPVGQWQSSRIVLQNMVTSAISQFVFRSVSLFLCQNCSVSLNANQDGFAFTLPDGAAYLTARSGSALLSNISSPLTISFAGADAGCLLFTLTLDNSGAKHPPDFDRLDVGCRFFANDQRWPGYGRLCSWRYPVFDPATPAAASLPLAATLDPLNPLLPERTFFSFLPDNISAGPTLSSFYVTNMGYRLALTPTQPADGARENVPRLVFAVRALTNPAQPYDPVYLTPAGFFTISTPLTQTADDGAIAVRVLCGSSGLEYLGLTDMAGNVLAFFPGQAAYAPTYPAGGTGEIALTTVATTSWGFVVGPQATGINYFAQPAQAPLFQATGDPTFLSFLEMSAGLLPGQISTDGATPTMFPIVAFPGIKDTADYNYQQFEIQVLNPVRRQIISQLAAPAPRPGQAGEMDSPLTAGTPQGLLAEFDPALTITLASTGGMAQQLKFANVQGPLFDAFQSNQLFLVLSSKAALQKYATLVGSPLSIVTDSQDTWQFDVFNGWDERQTLAIFKFNHKELGDLVADTTTWSFADTFNPELSKTQQRIQAILNEAQTRVATEPEFAYFVNTVVADPAWNGILFLNCEVPLNGLPDQIAGIAAGVDAKKFSAHHLGITETPLQTSGGVVQFSGDSALFGLIDYNDPAPLTPTAAAYQFKVLFLKVLFFNSTVTSFSSQVAFMANQFFAEPVTAPDTGHGKNTIVLNGTYQQQGETGTYLFLSTQDLCFTASSYVLANVEVVKAQFVTVVPPDQVQSGQPAESRFLLWGTLRFLALPDFDLFSFGDGDNTKGGITYAGLAVNIFYDPDEPQEKTFAFDTSQIAFDFSTSIARPDSLYARFPLTLSGLVQATTEQTTPASLGYTGVDAPVGQSSLTVPWFGLTFTLNLGSAGALAAASGFSATLLAAWSPNPNSASVSLGLKLPGSGAAQTTFSLESILKLKVRRIAFVLVEKAYVLNLNNIALSVLGLTLPPGGQTNVLLFGDPSGQDNATLGWYAGYVKNTQQ